MFESAELDLRVTKQEFAERVPHLRKALLDAQERLAGADFSVVMVIAGVEGAGKGETVNTLLEWLDARGIEVHALGAPSTEEAERPRLYRFWRRLPPRGRLAIFFGSWYSDPIVAHTLGGLDEDGLDHELDRIADFERMLANEGVLLVKLWLHVSKKQQRRVFEKLESDPDTAWRVSDRDWEFHATWDAFERASARTLRCTDRAHARWHVVAARDRRHREIDAGRTLLEALQKRLDAPPEPEPPPQVLPVPPRINVLNTLDLGSRLERDESKARRATAQGRLGRLARRLPELDRSVVVVFEGPDAAGKGGAIRRITRALDARWYRVIPISAPTDEEQARPYLWRFWRQLPARGHFSLFDRSWYGRVLVERIEGLATPSQWSRAYAEINQFEEQLVDFGTPVFKFWLAISPEEQLRRFEHRRFTPYKQHKLTKDDWRNRARWRAYEAAACDMIERTSTEIAPWHLVPADDKRFARVMVLETLCEGLERALGRDADGRASDEKDAGRAGKKAGKRGKRKRKRD